MAINVVLVNLPFDQYLIRVQTFSADLPRLTQIA